MAAPGRTFKLSAEQRAYYRARYQRTKDKGVCWSCHKRPTIPNTIRCRLCAKVESAKAMVKYHGKRAAYHMECLRQEVESLQRSLKERDSCSP